MTFPILPHPNSSLGPLYSPPHDCFVTNCSKDSVTNFEYMGQSMLEKVLKELMGNWDDKSYSKLYLYGPSGVSKSHLLMAVVLYLTWQGQHVVYIPDCYAALGNPFQYIQEALLFAFHNDNDSCDTITAVVQVDGL